METETIDSFRDEYRFLSNFYASPLEYGGHTYRSVEIAFQAQKCSTDEEKAEFEKLTNPVVAKRKGKTVKIDIAEWNAKAPSVMKELLTIKFSSPELREKLLATGDAVIIEGNRWHDNRWGHCTCAKCSVKPYQNLLGSMLMEIRENLKNAARSESNEG